MSEREMSNPHMPEEIVMDILSRLPVKSLLQFRSVSKKWKSIIDDGQQVKLHLSRSLLSPSSRRLLLPTFPLQSVNYDPSFIMANASMALDVGVGRGDMPKRTRKSYTPFRSKASNIGEVELTHNPTGSYNASSGMANASIELDCPFVSQNTLIKIVGSCNGLVCFLVKTDLIIYNPSTRRSKAFLAPQRRGSLVLGIDFVYGFGCSLSPIDFKMIALSRIARHSLVYPDLVRGQNDSSWRTRDLIRSFDFVDGVSTFLNGSLHWLAQRCVGEDIFIASFDISEEAFKEMCLPPNKNGLPYYNLGELKGDLYVLCDNSSYSHVDIWVMKEYRVDNSWMKFFRVPLHMGTGYISYMVPMSFPKEGEVLLEVNLRDFVTYDTKKKTFRTVMVRGGPSWPGDAVVYAESLVSPNAFQ